MKVRFLLVSTLVLSLPLPALAQDATTGAIEGLVTDAVTGEALIGASVIVRGKRGAGDGAITDEDGFYKVTGLAPGTYTVEFYYADIKLERGEVAVGVNSTTPVPARLSGEVIITYGPPPPIDPNDTARKQRIGRKELEHLVIPGTDMESALGITAGTANDGVGVAVSGSSSLENQYVVDGVVTTGLKYGQSGSTVLNDFIEEIEVITGGYNAEYGRATGGVINVVTRSGGNEVTGSVFAYLTPGFAVAARERTPSQATSIDGRADLDYDLDFGVEVGGPIIKDRLWYWVGLAPQLSSTTTTRVTRRRADCRVTMASGALNVAANQPCSALATEQWVSDGQEDVDPETGFFIYEDLDSSKLQSRSQAYSIIGKLNAAVSPQHQGQVSLQVTPELGGGQRVAGFVDEQRLETASATTDAAMKWTSKLNDDRTELEGIVGFHRSSYRFGSEGGARDDQALQVLYFGNLGTWSRLGGESAGTAAGCADNTAGDPYEFITNCPDVGVGYAIGGPGSLADDVEQRLSARLGVTHRVDALGNHEIKGGVDVEDNQIDTLRAFSGDQFLENYLDRAQINSTHWVKLTPDGEGAQTCRDTDLELAYSCEFLTQDDPEAFVRGETINWSAYLRDSWRIQPNLTVNAGMRYEEQRLRYAGHLRDSTDPLTGRDLGTNAMVLQNMWAPRVGALYDWTKEGRSKIYGHWGRFYESIPMDINERSFGGEVTHERLWDAGSQCGPGVDGIGGADGNNCGVGDPDDLATETLFGSGVLVAPDIKAQYLDETILGADYEVAEDLTLSIAFQHRALGRVIEDVSVDGAQTYVIANPGEWSADAEADLMAQIEAASDPAERSRLSNELDQYRAIRAFDTPRRDYTALQFQLQRRFSKELYLQASYTYSRTAGNYPGLISYDNGQIDPNISSQYDLIELLANRNGPLPQDRPHYVKLDTYYTFDLKKAGDLTFGARARALSGTPVDVLGKHYLYGVGESFLLPRGSLRRTDFDYGLDLHVDYGQDLAYGMRVSVFADVFNVSNSQGTFSVDEDYTYLSSVNPIVGGTYEDLIFAKEQSTAGAETNVPIKRNPNFGRTASRYAPLSARFGARLTF